MGPFNFPRTFTASLGAVILPRLLVLSSSPSGPPPPSARSSHPLLGVAAAIFPAGAIVPQLSAISHAGPWRYGFLSLDVMAHPPHPQGPAPKSATCPISPPLPSRHQQALGALVPLKCTQLCLFSASGLICLPRGGTCPVPHLWVQQDAERGRPGLGLGGQPWTLPCGTARAGC